MLVLSDGGLPLLHFGARTKSFRRECQQKKKRPGQRFPFGLVYYSSSATELLVCLVVGACRGPVLRAHEVLSRVKKSSGPVSLLLLLSDYCSASGLLLWHRARLPRPEIALARSFIASKKVQRACFFSSSSTVSLLQCYCATIVSHSACLLRPQVARARIFIASKKVQRACFSSRSIVRLLRRFWDATLAHIACLLRPEVARARSFIASRKVQRACLFFLLSPLSDYYAAIALLSFRAAPKILQHVARHDRRSLRLARGPSCFVRWPSRVASNNPIASTA